MFLSWSMIARLRSSSLSEMCISRFFHIFAQSGDELESFFKEQLATKKQLFTLLPYCTALFVSYVLILLFSSI
jgi:hypothetical protein